MEVSSQSWRQGYSSTNKSNEAREPSSTKTRRRRPQTKQVDPVSKVDLENIMQELQQLKKIWLGQEADQDMDSNPLSVAIQAEVVPATLRVPKEKFNGMIDLTDYVATFESHMNLYGATDAIKCRAFLATFKGVALTWYNSLSTQSITNFKHFKKLFVGPFMANKRRPKKMANLWSITQGKGETVERYTKRFTIAYSCMANLDEDFSIQAYIAGVLSCTVYAIHQITNNLCSYNC